MESPSVIRHRAMTMIEVLVVSGVIAILASILLPSLGAARESAKTVMCATQVSQLIRANLYYADENDSTYCAGAEGMRATPERRTGINLHRWYGTRATRHDAFTSRGGPLTPYLDDDGRIRQCPTFPAAEIAANGDGFEVAAGGYGYNNAFIGRKLHRLPSGAYEVLSTPGGARTHEVRQPFQTIMFTDTAFAESTLIEYSFAEPRFHPENPRFRADPSLHFRHRGRANIGWVDGHVDAFKMTFTHHSGFYESVPQRYGIGWFGKSDDNRLFDLD